MRMDSTEITVCLHVAIHVCREKPILRYSSRSNRSTDLLRAAGIDSNIVGGVINRCARILQPIM